jgi:glycosyltransferase involved in cell wall biosynthesis
VIFGDLFSFPEGNAATNRVFTFVKGFKENGENVSVICFKNEYVPYVEGIAEGIPYYHAFGQTVRSKSFIRRRFLYIRKYFKALCIIRNINRKEKVAAINIQTNLFSTHLLAWFMAKFTHSKLVVECCEHPLRHFQKNSMKKREGMLKFRVESFLSDGILCISRFLMDFNKKYGVKESKLFLVPSTVDIARFKVRDEKPFPFFYIGYFGGLTFYRDSVDTLLKAFASISNQYPEINLVLGGFCSADERKQLTDLISELDITPRVKLLEYLAREEVIKYIVHADILVMVRSNDLEATASFPSKLTEFLVTGKPVISVTVGEISDYLKDGANGFLVPPEDPVALTQKLRYVIDNYDSAISVAQEGKKLTEEIFSYNFQAKRIIDFINSL